MIWNGSAGLADAVTVLKKNDVIRSFVDSAGLVVVSAAAGWFARVLAGPSLRHRRLS